MKVLGQSQHCLSEISQSVMSRHSYVMSESIRLAHHADQLLRKDDTAKPQQLFDIGRTLPHKIYYHEDFIKSQCFSELYKDPVKSYKSLINDINIVAKSNASNLLLTINDHKFQRGNLYLVTDTNDYSFSACREKVVNIKLLDQYLCRLRETLRSLHEKQIVLANISASNIADLRSQKGFCDYTCALKVPTDFYLAYDWDLYCLGISFANHVTNAIGKKLPAAVSASTILNIFDSKMLTIADSPEKDRLQKMVHRLIGQLDQDEASLASLLGNQKTACVLSRT